jgi:transcriptional regulator of heat shock response
VLIYFDPFVLQTRTELILKLIIEDYIVSAEPVGSKYLNERYQIGVSDATVRNEMSILEKEGYLRQPHTSAGRIPTEKSYVYYLQHLRDKQFVLKGSPLKHIEENAKETELALKRLAKKLAELSGETAIVAFDPRWSYYVGVSNLFHKPDFQTIELVKSLSEVIDQFDDIIRHIYKTVPEEPHVYIGANSPFGHHVAAVVVRYTLKDDQQGVLGLVGPLRMDYNRNLALVERAKEVIDASNL